MLFIRRCLFCKRGQWILLRLPGWIKMVLNMKNDPLYWFALYYETIMSGKVDLKLFDFELKDFSKLNYG